MTDNLRYAISYCVFGYPEHEVSDSPCKTSQGCGHYEEAAKYNNLSTDVAAYEYCNAWPGDRTFRVDQCQDCLQLEGNSYMANC